MAVLHKLSIRNFRGLKEFDQVFDTGLTCIIGRGDSGKSTILDAINYVFSSSWGIHFNDSDFYNCDMTNPIVIEGTVTGVPEKLLSQYAAHVRGILPNGDICDDMEDPGAAELVSALTIRLTVTKDLEPSWDVVSNRGQEPMPIKSSRRALLNVFSVADFNDRHFSLNKGNPLYTLYKQLTGEDILDGENKVLDVMREAKKEFDTSISDKFKEVIDKVKVVATELGVNLNEITAALDHRDIAISENKVSIHEEGVPFRLKGKGSKRLLSLAIQMSLTQPSGIILIDEIEQGLEPDRVQHLVYVLSRYTDKQIFITTHSSHVIVEILCNSLCIMRENHTSLIHVKGCMQNVVRSNPEAFFAKKVIVCEGPTEIGIFRAINEYMLNNIGRSASHYGVRFANGGGRNMDQYVRGFIGLGYQCCLFCDSDDDNINAQKKDFVAIGVEVVDCLPSNYLEKQVFADLPMAGVTELIGIYRSIIVNEEDGLISEDDADKCIFDSVKSKSMNGRDTTYSQDWACGDSSDLREALAKASISKKNPWFKNQTRGMLMGRVILKYCHSMSDTNHLKVEVNKIIEWVKD